MIKRDKHEEPPVRKLPWYIDIFLYPTSVSGLINLGIYTVLTLLLGFFAIHAQTSPVLTIVLFLIAITITGYLYYYFFECIRDSAKGGIRAPENIGSMPDRSEALTQLWDIFVSIIIFWGPILGYFVYINLLHVENPGKEYNPMTDTIFWILLGYGIFFFPVGILALAMFSSSSAYNPVLWITSIFSTFFQYCGLIIFFIILALLVFRIARSFQGGVFNGVILNAIFMYLAMVAAHLLGRFYYNNSEKLKWEV